MSTNRYQQGLDRLKHVDGKAGEDVIEQLATVSPEFADLVVEFPFGDIYSREGLDLRSREIATLGAITVLGCAEPQLKVHIHAALNVGVTKDEIKEIIMQMAVYGGFPVAINAMLAAKDVFDQYDMGSSNLSDIDESK